METNGKSFKETIPNEMNPLNGKTFKKLLFEKKNPQLRKTRVFSIYL